MPEVCVHGGGSQGWQQFPQGLLQVLSMRTGEAATQTDRHSNGGTGGEWSTIYTRVACLIECVHYDLERQCTNKEDGIIVYTGEWS